MFTTPQPHGPRAVIDSLSAALRREAHAAVGMFSQFPATYWDGWQVVEIARQVTTKGGVRFDAGEIALLRPTQPGDEETPGYVYPWSRKGNLPVAVPASWVRPVLVDEDVPTYIGSAAVAAALVGATR